MIGSPAALIDHRQLKPSKRGTVARTIATAIAFARLSDLTRHKIQEAIAKLRDTGWSLQTCNHYRASAKAFSKWCSATDRTKEDTLYGVKGYNAKEDPRHDRRTIALDELILLIGTAERGPVVMGMSGPARSLCYQLAATTGLRYSEIASIVPASFNWETPSVSVSACYTKNGDPATLPIPRELADDLAAYVAPLNPQMPVFPLPPGKGAKMLRVDLKDAGIAYCDASGQFFDFHSLRCEMATLADAAGVSPRVVQRLMRHSSLELTGRYTRPRAVDIDAAASMLPSLKPSGEQPEALAATGTDGQPISRLLSLHLPLAGDADVRTGSSPDVMTGPSASTIMMGSFVENAAKDVDLRLGIARGVEEAPPGFEPGMKVFAEPLSEIPCIPRKPYSVKTYADGISNVTQKLTQVACQGGLLQALAWTQLRRSDRYPIALGNTCA
jgi:integrase